MTIIETKHTNPRVVQQPKQRRRRISAPHPNCTPQTHTNSTQHFQPCKNQSQEELPGTNNPPPRSQSFTNPKCTKCTKQITYSLIAHTNRGNSDICHLNLSENASNGSFHYALCTQLFAPQLQIKMHLQLYFAPPLNRHAHLCIVGVVRHPLGIKNQS